MEEVELVAKFESEETARSVARVLNAWVHWVWEGNIDEPPELFEDFGLATDDYAFDRDSDLDWNDVPRVRARASGIVISLESSETVELLQELLEALGAFEVYEADEDDDEEED